MRPQDARTLALAVQEQSVEYELASEEIRSLIDAIPELVLTLAEVDSIIGWDTTCANCAKLLDRSYTEHEELHRAKQMLSRINSMPLLVEDDAAAEGFNSALRAIRAYIRGADQRKIVPEPETILPLLGGLEPEEHL